MTVSPFIATLRWMAAHARFPVSRLPARAELLLLIATAAQMETEEETPRYLIERRQGDRDASLKAHTLRRSQVHYRCDNSAKV